MTAKTGTDGSAKAARPGDGKPAEQRDLKLSHSVSWAVFGQLGYVLTQMVILAALAQLRGPEAVGQFGLALALTTPFFMFVNLGQASDVTGAFTFSEYGGLLILSAGAAALLSLGAGLLFASGPTFLILVIVTLTKMFEAVSKLAYGEFQRTGRVERVAVSLVRRGLVTAPLFIVFLLLGFPTATAFFAQLLVWSMFALFRDYPSASRVAEGRLVYPSLEFGRILKLGRETAPLGPAYFFNSLVVSLPRLVVERYLGLSAVGVLTAVNYLQQAGTLIANSVSQMLVSRFARLRNSSDTATLRRNILVILAFSAGLSVIGMALVYLAGEWVLATAFGREFAAAHGLLILVALAVCLRLFSIVPQTLLHADRRFKSFLVREMAAVAVCAGLLFLLVPALGLIGAGYAILGAALWRLIFGTSAVLSARGPARLQPAPAQSGFDTAGAS